MHRLSYWNIPEEPCFLPLPACRVIFLAQDFSTKSFAVWGNPGKIQDSQMNSWVAKIENPGQSNGILGSQLDPGQDFKKLIILWFQQKMPRPAHHPLSCSVLYDLATIVLIVCNTHLKNAMHHIQVMVPYSSFWKRWQWNRMQMPKFKK